MPCLLDVALTTHSPCEGRVNFVLEELRILRSMGSMAVPAIHDRSIYVQMSLGETRPLETVTLPAQGLYGLTQ